MKRTTIVMTVAAALGVSIGGCGAARTATPPSTPTSSAKPVGATEVPVSGGGASDEQSCGAGMKEGHCGAEPASSAATPPK